MFYRMKRKMEFRKIMVTTLYLVKKLGVMSVAKFGATIGMIIGIIGGIIIAINIGPSAALAGGSMFWGVGSGIMTFCVNVLFGSLLGFLGGAVIAFIYNLAPCGIEADLEIR
jgi:uncharacterized protein YqgC (DUF456 family)